MPLQLTKTALARILVAAGSKLVGDMITTPFTASVSSYATGYNVTCKETTSGFTKVLTGTQYKVVEPGSHFNEVYLEGICPQNFRTQKFANDVFYQMFKVDAVHVVSWF
jgi:hypothetical protein